MENAAFLLLFLLFPLRLHLAVLCTESSVCLLRIGTRLILPTSRMRDRDWLRLDVAQ
ncbi:hypothetical protein WH47_05139 [Habropoda laboriosa]|uniref:Uncharacterized protein n=1 Tax=Habropoda laboriosa TaxID=597456 RepID=A0A0L7QSA8_9HYME|nr:hypothetical protein WH47_05139 [Habropoda laboriosa]